jgi:hypothetical protein
MVKLNGPLTLKWVERAVPAHLFRPAMNSPADPLRLGWEPLEPVKKPALTLEVERIFWASAEGTVALASIVETVRSAGFGVQLSGPNPRDHWARVLQLKQLNKAQWNDPESTLDGDLGRGRGDQLRRWMISSQEACRRIADFISTQAAQVSNDATYLTSGVEAAVDLLAHQALLNVYEHAYASGVAPVAFSSITVSQARNWSGLRSFLTSEEYRWFESGNEMVLEVAIGDRGIGVPSTLWEAYGRRYPGSLESMKHLSITTNEGLAERARVQQQITLWALAHDSTRKLAKDFPDDIHRLNWRGLHRAANCIAEVNGCIIVRSGQARTGYAFHEGRVETIGVGARARPSEFPGTTLVIRVPIPAPTFRHTRTRVTKPARQHWPFDEIVPSSAAKELIETPGDLPRLVAVCHPFRTIDADASSRLLDLIRSIPPNYIQVHAYVQLAADNILSQFHAFEDDHEYYLPRMVCFWSGERTHWKLVGKMPACARAFVRELETRGNVAVPTELLGFATELHRAYAPYITLNDGAMLLEAAKHGLYEDFDNLLQCAFDEFVGQPGSKRWLADEYGTLIRLRSGRLVRRYISVLELLNANDLLAQCVGRKLASRLRRLQSQNESVRVITDSEASYFLARHLLNDQKVSIDLEPVSTGVSLEGPTVAFLDAVYRGETMKSFSARQTERVGGICAIDLRKSDSRSSKAPFFEALLKLPFDPIEVSEEDAGTASRVKELDQITLDPCEPADPNECALGTSMERTDFIMGHPELLRYGVHVSGGRIHVVSHSMEQIIRKHSRELAQWSADEVTVAIERALPKSKKREVVLFTRSDSHVRDMVSRIAEKLEDLGIGNTSVFAASIPAAPYKSREVFGRVDPEQDLLANVQHLGVQGHLALGLPTNYIAVLLDDAAVTGRGLLNFLIRLSRARKDTRPRAIIAVPVFSRLSPAEEALYGGLLKAVGPEGEAGVRFEFAPLFRLQVQSYDDAAATPAFKHLAVLESHERKFGSFLSKYLGKVRARLTGTVAKPGRPDSVRTICAHPFYSGNEASDTLSVSARTVWIRHLIALYEQNIAVLGQLLHELRESCLSEDASLLTLFATEPSLLELRPFQRHCRQDLVELAVRTLKSNEFGNPLKSDAIVVLLGSQLPTADLLADTAAAIEHDDDLLSQFLVMLLANTGAEHLNTADVGRVIGSRIQTKGSTVRAALKTWEELRVPHSAYDLREATHEVIVAVTHTIYHAIGDRNFNALTTRWIQMAPPETRAASPGDEVTEFLSPALQAVREWFLPALAGLEYIARHQQNGHAIGALGKAHANAIHYLNELHEFSASLGTEPLTLAGTANVENLWLRVKECTQFVPPQTYLARPPVSGEAVGTLEAWMPAFFCLPEDVARELTRSWKEVIVTANWQQPAIGISAVLLPAPLADVREAFELLFADARRHGTGNIQVEFVRRVTGSDASMEVFVNNTVSSTRNPGNGQSQRLVQDIAARHTWKVDFPSTVKRGEPYRVRLSFPRVYDIHKD